MKIRDQSIFITDNLHVYMPDNRYAEPAFIRFISIMHPFKPALFSAYVKLHLWDMIWQITELYFVAPSLNDRSSVYVTHLICALPAVVLN